MASRSSTTRRTTGTRMPRQLTYSWLIQIQFLAFRRLRRRRFYAVQAKFNLNCKIVAKILITSQLRPFRQQRKFP